MKTTPIFYAILAVYALLWACQLVVCHMTHSLIILTDSYINLYKILDISLAILHLSTQRELTKKQLAGNKSASGLKEPMLAGRLFDCICTYQFKRLPLLGSFMNGLFLAALLMSAAIEGIQTCVHSSHSQSPHDESILHRDKLTYPLILAGFALVGLIMQHCSLRAHQMCDQELQSESLLDLSSSATTAKNKSQRDLTKTTSINRWRPNNAVVLRELSVNNLDNQQASSVLSSASSSTSLGKRRSYDLNKLQRQSSATSGPSSSRNALKSRQGSLQELPMSLAEREIPNNRETRISLKSLKFAINLESIVPPPLIDAPIGSISRDLESTPPLPLDVSRLNRDNWFLIRYLTSPLALAIYALINYFISDPLLTEISDASLSICVVLLLFAASYPPMKKAGRVLLQTAPDGVDLVRLEEALLGSSPHVLRIENLHVWSLTPRSNRVATCELHLDQEQVTSEKQIELIILEARDKFLDQNIKCTTIEPVLKSRSSANNEEDSK